MKTNNEKWQGSSKGKSTAGAGRDGKPFEKRDVKSILKGSRGAAKFGSDKPAREENRTGGNTDYKKRDDSRPAYGERKPFSAGGDNKPAYGERKPWENRDNKPAYGDRKPYGADNKTPYGERKPWENRDSKPSFDRKPASTERYIGGEGKPTYAERKAAESKEGRPSFGEKKSFQSSEGRSSYGERKPYENREGRPAYGEKKPWENRDSKPAYGDRKPAYGDRKPAFGDRKPAYGDRKPAFGAKKPWESRDSRPLNTDANGDKIYGRFQESNDDETRPEKLTFQKLPEGKRSEFTETRYDNKKDGVSFRKRSDDNYDPNAKYSNKKQLEYRKTMVDLTKPIRLNKFLANAGICSRREADEYIVAGVISVNGQIVTEMGVKVLHTDKVMFHEQAVQSEKKVYLLLNKPKDCVTTSEDTHDRLTVLDLVKNACSERIYPVGRLDRNTTGVLLLTNDGDLASKLTHPKYDKKKIYHVALDKPLIEEDYNKIIAGITLDEDVIKADALEFVKEGDLKQVGIEIHSGQNRVVRRIFEKLGYKVIRLDRVYFAGLTKKSLPRGKYRFLSEREVQMLKMGAHE
jgi:23S rRNA pseudouridine2605 synthase